MSIPSEIELVQKIKEWVGEEYPASVEVGIGDDCAVVKSASENTVLTTDSLVEGIHFNFDICTPKEIGIKAATANLSDIAAMGAKPKYLLVNLVLTEKQDLEFVRHLFEGLKERASEFSVAIVGGNVARSNFEFSVHLTVVGEAENVLLRSGARPGDWVALTGELGVAAAGLDLLLKDAAAAKRDFQLLTQAWLAPVPRVREISHLMTTGAVTSCIDVSDGLSSELLRLSQHSQCGFVIEEARLSIAKDLVRAAEALGRPTWTACMQWFLNGGEDYQLLMTLDPEKREPLEDCLQKNNFKLFVIGEVKYWSDGIRLKRRDGTLQLMPPEGWDHFK